MEKKCNCEDFKNNIGKVNNCFSISSIHDFKYDGKFFDYCPWCGKELSYELSIYAKIENDKSRYSSLAPKDKNVRCTCGHWVVDLDETYSATLPYKDIDYEKECFVNSVVHVSLCKDCIEKYKKLNMVLSKSDTLKYINGEIDFDQTW